MVRWNGGGLAEIFADVGDNQAYHVRLHDGFLQEAGAVNRQLADAINLARTAARKDIEFVQASVIEDILARRSGHRQTMGNIRRQLVAVQVKQMEDNAQALIDIEGQSIMADKNTKSTSKINVILPRGFLDNSIFIDLFILSFFSEQRRFF